MEGESGSFRPGADAQGDPAPPGARVRAAAPAVRAIRAASDLRADTAAGSGARPDALPGAGRAGGAAGIAGADPRPGGRGADPPASGVRATSFLERALLRRRLRYLTRRRELALHDLGGFVFESHRMGERRPDLESEKLAALDSIDTELARLQRALELREELAVLHEPGIASCPQCRAIHDSGANFCPSCGRPTASAPPA